MQESQAGATVERVHLVFLGPLPKVPRVNEQVLMIVDQSTKWVECIPLPAQTAEVRAKAAVDKLFSRFADKGKNFESKLSSAIYEAQEIHKTRITPYKASVNGQVERYNRTL